MPGEAWAEEVKVTLTFDMGEVTINLHVISSDHYIHAKVEASFGAIGTEGEPITPLPLPGWNLKDSYSLLTAVSKVCFSTYEGEMIVETIRNDMEEHDNGSDYEVDPEFDSKEIESSIYTRLAPLMKQRGYTAFDIDYSVSMDHEQCMITPYRDNQKLRMMDIIWERRCNMVPDCELYNAKGLDKEFLYELIQLAMPVTGKLYVDYLKRGGKPEDTTWKGETDPEW